MTNILLITTSNSVENRIHQVLSSQEFKVIQISSISSVSSYSNGHPEVIIADKSSLNNQFNSYINLLNTTFPEVPVLLIAEDFQPEEFTSAFRSGVFDLVELSVNDLSFLNIIPRAVHKRKEWLSVQQFIEQLKLFNSNLQKKVDDLKNQIESNVTFTESIMMAIGAGLATFDMSGKITFANNSASSILGWSVENLLNIEFSKILPIEADLGQILDGSEFEKQYEVETIRGDGKKIRIGYTLFPRKNNHGDIIGMVCMFRDLFKIEKIREENRRLDKIATLGQIAAGIAHEVKNPLAAIQSIVQVVSLDFDENDIRSTKFKQIFKEVERINQLLENSFSFLRSKKMNFSISNITAVLNSVIDLMSADFQKKGIAVDFKILNEIPNSKMDATQIHQVILNLMINAADSILHGGNIFITVEHLVAPKHTKGFIVIKIKDTGVGIQKSDLKRIFDPFFTTKPFGTGLGLPITYKIIQDHSGKLDVETEVGKGTTFIISLPD